MIRTDFLSDTQVRHRDYDGLRAVHPNGMSSGETVIKVIAVVAALFLLFGSILTGNPVALVIVLPVIFIGGGLTFRYPDRIVYFLSNLRRSSYSRNPQVVVVDSGRPTVFASSPYGSRGGTAHVAVGGGHAPTTHTTRSYSGAAPQVAVGGGHAPTTHATRSYAGGPAHVAVGGGHAPTTHTTVGGGGRAHVAVGGGHAPTTHTTVGGGGRAHVAVGGGHNPVQNRTPDGRVPVGSRSRG